MRKSTTAFLAVLGSFLVFVAVACNNGTSKTVNPPPKVTTTSLPIGMKGTAYSFTLMAGGGTGAYTWSVSGGSLPSWASLDASAGTIAGMPDAAATTNFSVTVTDAAGLSDDQALSLVINPPAPLVISNTSLPDGIVGFPYGAGLQATGGISPYTWSVASGTLPSWANLSSGTGVINGTPGATETSSFTVQVADSQDPPASATQVLSITVAAPDSTNNGELKGQYAFLLQGFDDATGSQFAIIGSFIADGNGNITGGLEDINGPGGYQPAVTFTGAYNVRADHRGLAAFTSSLGTTTFAIAVGSLENTVATRGSLIEFDDTNGTAGKRGSGFLSRQNTDRFHLADLNGPYAFQFTAQTEVLTGAYAVDGNGNVTNGRADANVGGSMQSEIFTGTISTDGNTAAFGRVTNTPAGLPFHFIYYIVTESRALAMSTDPGSTSHVLAGEVLAQASNSFSVASLNGTAVSYSVGLAPMFDNQDSSITAGLWSFNSSVSPVASYSLDWIQSWWADVGTWDYYYTVDEGGRVTTTSVMTEMPAGPIFYLVDTNKGFFMATDGTIDAGFLEPQDGRPFSTSSILGNYFLGTVAPFFTSSVVVSGVGTSSGDGTVNFRVDKSLPTGLLNSNLSFSLSPTISSTGRAEHQAVVLYMISPKKIVIMSDPNDASPTIMILQQ